MQQACGRLCGRGAVVSGVCAPGACKNSVSLSPWYSRYSRLLSPFQFFVLQVLASTRSLQLFAVQLLASTQAFQRLGTPGTREYSVVSAFGTPGTEAFKMVGTLTTFGFLCDNLMYRPFKCVRSPGISIPWFRNKRWGIEHFFRVPLR